MRLQCALEIANQLLQTGKTIDLYHQTCDILSAFEPTHLEFEDDDLIPEKYLHN